MQSGGRGRPSWNQPSRGMGLEVVDGRSQFHRLYEEELFQSPQPLPAEAPIKDSRNIFPVPPLSMWWPERCAREASQFPGPASCPFSSAFLETLCSLWGVAEPGRGVQIPQSTPSTVPSADHCSHCPCWPRYTLCSVFCATEDGQWLQWRKSWGRLWNAAMSGLGWLSGTWGHGP